jgi:hypothetical protein
MPCLREFQARLWPIGQPLKAGGHLRWLRSAVPNSQAAALGRATPCEVGLAVKSSGDHYAAVLVQRIASEYRKDGSVPVTCNANRIQSASCACRSVSQRSGKFGNPNLSEVMSAAASARLVPTCRPLEADNNVVRRYRQLVRSKDRSVSVSSSISRGRESCSQCAEQELPNRNFCPDTWNCPIGATAKWSRGRIPHWDCRGMPLTFDDAAAVAFNPSSSTAALLSSSRRRYVFIETFVFAKDGRRLVSCSYRTNNIRSIREYSSQLRLQHEPRVPSHPSTP